MDPIIPKNSLFIIDGSSFLYRAFYALKPLSAPDGTLVQAVYGFARMLKKVIDKNQPEHLLIVWDSPGKTLRHAVYAEYKATREAPPKDLFTQKELILELASRIGISQLSVPGIEADDLIYSVAQAAKCNNQTAVIITSDKDLRQMLDESCFIFDPFLDQFLDRAAVEKIYGFPLERLPLYFAILGDASDNIPGVSGIGKKGAEELAQTYTSIEDIYARIDSVKPKLRKYLEASKDDALLSYELFKLRNITRENTSTHYPFDIKQWEQANPFFEQLGFKSLLTRTSSGISIQTQTSVFAPEKTETITKIDARLVCVHTKQELIEIDKVLTQSKEFALDTETTPDHIPVGLSICCADDCAYYIPFGHGTDEPQLHRSEVGAWLKPYMESTEYKKIFHHAKFDIQVLSKLDIKTNATAFDTMIAAHLLLDEDQSVGLKNLSASLLGEPMLSFADMVEKKGRTSFDQVPLEEATQYAAVDALQTWKLYKIFEPHIKERSLETIFYDIELPLIDVLCAMEHEGIYLDKGIAEHNNKSLEELLRVIREQIDALLGPQYKDLNLNSPKQLQKVLYTDLALTPSKKTTKTKSYSTDQEALESLKDKHPLIPLLLRHREIQKLLSTYGYGLLAARSIHGKIHTSYSQTRTATGRLASSDPNMQNIPTGAANSGISIRSAFVAPVGYCYLSADYSQIELRVLAQLSGDEKLVHAFLHNQDVHALPASGLFGVHVEEVTYNQRQIAKKINFSILYGQSAYRLAKDLDVGFSQAKEFHEKFWLQYPGVVTWMAATIDKVRECGRVCTWCGRQRSIPGIYEANKQLYEAATRIAINTPCQGTAAEILKKGMIELNKRLREQKLDAKILLQIHDELIVQIAQKDTDAVCALVKDTLENIMPEWRVPLKASLHIGNSWQALK